MRITGRRGRQHFVLASAWGLALAVFALDVALRADTVTVCFAYALPIALGAYAPPGTPYRLAAACTLASVVGAFVRPPAEGIGVSFVANRDIAIAAQWLVALLVEQQRRARLAVEDRLAEERHKAEAGRRFVQILTHEITTALTTIDGQGYRLERLARIVSPADVVARAGKIRQAVARLDALVGRVRLAAEIGTGDLAPTRAPVEAAVLLDPLRGEFEGAAVAVNVRTPEPALFGDPGLVYQAVANLVSNAVKYSPAPATVVVTVDRSDWLDGAVVAVADRGVGIAAAEIDRVFEPYYRAGNSAGVRGIGVGLHLVRGYVEAHGGAVDIASEPGQGTTVRLHLPDPPRLADRP